MDSTVRSSKQERIMSKTYAITTASNAIRYVAASSRQAACFKLTGMREPAAMAAKQIKGIKLCKE